MAEVKKARLFLRRGTDTDRELTTLCEGELGYSTDAFRVVVGDGTTAGGRSLGATVFVSGGTASPNFHTNLTTASANGIALSGDFAVVAAASYVNGAGATVYPTTTTGTSATTVMLLTGGNAGEGTSWVAVNSGIPWGNIDTPVDAISGDQIHGGDISGNVTFSGQLSTTASTVVSAAGDVHVAELVGTGVRNVVATATGQLSAVEPSATTEIASNATGLPVAMVTFGQQGSGSKPTLRYSMNIDSTAAVAASASSVAGTITDLNTHIDIGDASGYPRGADVVYVANSEGTAVLLGGIYMITFANALGSGYAERPVVITTANYRGDNPSTKKKQDAANPVIDYKFLSQTELLVVFSAPEFTDKNTKNRGYLRDLYPSAGVPSDLTRFTVQVY